MPANTKGENLFWVISMKVYSPSRFHSIIFGLKAEVPEYEVRIVILIRCADFHHTDIAGG